MEPIDAISAYHVARAIVEHIASIHGGYDDERIDDDSDALARIVNVDFPHALALAVNLDYACMHDIPSLIDHARRAIHGTAAAIG